MNTLLEKIVLNTEKIARNTEPKESFSILLSERSSQIKTKFNPQIGSLISYLNLSKNLLKTGIIEVLRKESLCKSTYKEVQNSKTSSAIKGFTKQYTIDGTRGIDSLSFLNAIRPDVVNPLSENRQTKINLVLMRYGARRYANRTRRIRTYSIRLED